MSDRQRVLQALHALEGSAATKKVRLRSIWVQGTLGLADDGKLIDWLGDPDPHVRGWAIQFAGERRAALPPRLLECIIRLAAQEDSLVVRRYAASLAQRLPFSQRLPILQGLASHSLSQSDRNIPWLVWYALEPLVEELPEQAFEIAIRSNWVSLLRFTVRRASESEVGRATLIKRLVDGDAVKHTTMVLEELLAQSLRRGGVEMPEGWSRALSRIKQSGSVRDIDLARQLAVQFGDDSVFPFFRERLRDGTLSPAVRLSALESLRTGLDHRLPDQLLGLIFDEDVSAECVAALADFQETRIAQQLLDQFNQLSPKTQTAALGTLVSRLASAKRLVSAMESGSIPPDGVPAFIVQQAVAFGDVQMQEKLSQIWGQVSLGSNELAGQYARYREMLAPRLLERASASAGRLLYEANCGKCHVLFGEGGQIGPEITGANRTDVNYWLENILEPNALIGRAYQVTRFLVDDGRVVNGVVIGENEDAVEVQTATEKIVLKLDEIEVRSLSEVSLMPEGQLQTMTDQDVRNLFRYLMSPVQVAPAGQSSEVLATSTKKSHPDAIVLEAESLQAKTSRGWARPQQMTGFGTDWSGGRQLWWTGGQPGDTMLLPV
ncbi:MAG: cytochrome C, partial [Planctomycetota bacterium]